MGGNPISSIDPNGLNPVLALYRSFNIGFKIGEAINPYVQPYIARALDSILGDPLASSNGDGEVVAKDCKQLSKGEIKKLQAGGEDPHNIKPKVNGAHYDLYKAANGDIYIFKKGGVGYGSPPCIKPCEKYQDGALRAGRFIAVSTRVNHAFPKRLGDIWREMQCAIGRYF